MSLGSVVVQRFGFRDDDDMTWGKTKKKAAIIFTVLLLPVMAVILFSFSGIRHDALPEMISISEILGKTSERKTLEGSVHVDMDEPSLALVATPIACWYNTAGEGYEGPDAMYGLLPMLVVGPDGMSTPQQRFEDYVDPGSVLALGNGIDGDTTFSGTPSKISIEAARHIFLRAAGALIVMDDPAGYELGITAAPLASYLNIPILLIDEKAGTSETRKVLKDLDTEYVIVLGEDPKDIARDLGRSYIPIQDNVEAEMAVMEVVKERFGRIDYIAMTNPRDVRPPSVISSEERIETIDVDNVLIRTGSGNVDVVGESTQTFDIEVPDGIQRLRVFINFTKVQGHPLDPLKDMVEIEPMIFASIYDPEGNIAANAPSFSYDIGRNYLETMSYYNHGSYRLTVTVFYGSRGFDTYLGTSLGLSRIEAQYQLTTSLSEMNDPHLPLFPGLSVIAPYAAASRGGLVLAEGAFEMTDGSFGLDASGHGTGPWYDPGLHDPSNIRAEYCRTRLNDTLEMMGRFDLLESYLSGPAWLAIIAGHNMIPQYYVPKGPSWEEDPIYGTGWPTDVYYSFDVQLSVGRLIATDAADLSALLVRTLFYEDYTESHSAKIRSEYGSGETWKDHFHFHAGELGGRTGWFFWQREFAGEVTQHGFVEEQYFRNGENDRQTMLIRGAYERANYFDLMLHGNWYSYSAELNGVDSYSTSVKVTDIMKAPQDWELGPSMFISGTCLLGRIDGIPSGQSITMAFIHAGVNAFFSASRSTGSESKAGTVEQSLLYDNISVGEAWRMDKTVNTEPAAFYVRNLFGDPAFDPYEPENGYSDQGRPELIASGK